MRHSGKLASGFEIESRSRWAAWASRGVPMSKQTKITIETDSLLILRGRSLQAAWCAQCGSEVEMIPLDGVGVISNMASSEVEAWIQSEDLHHSKATDGSTLICLNSMIKRVHKANSSS
jgi:hypothetical protein